MYEAYITSKNKSMLITIDGAQIRVPSPMGDGSNILYILENKEEFEYFLGRVQFVVQINGNFEIHKDDDEQQREIVAILKGRYNIYNAMAMFVIVPVDKNTSCETVEI